MSALALALGACGREDSFDVRYSESENEIAERARELDEQLNEANANGALHSADEVRPR